MAYEMYGDESADEQLRFRSFSVLSGPQDQLADLRAKAEAVSEGWAEAKFTQVTGHSRNCRVARAFVDVTVCAASVGSVRMDVIIWDTHDRRHAVHGRDDTANFGRMAYHLMQQIARRHAQSDWAFYPDAGGSVNWIEVMEYLNNTRLSGPGRTRQQGQALFHVETPFISLTRFSPVDSKSERLVQVADLFAGLACLSRHEEPACGHYHAGEWQQAASGAVMCLPFDDVERLALTNRKRAQYELVCHTYDACRSCKLGVSLRSTGYLRTPDWRNPVNFWHYEPQHEDDQAPTRDLQ